MTMYKLDDRYINKAAVLDIEVYRNYFLVCLKSLSSGRTLHYVLDQNNTPDWARLRAVLKKYMIITFNGTSYDIPLIFLAMSGASNDALKDASNRIIESGMKPWEVPGALGICIPEWLDHVDLIEPAPGVRVNLKTYNGRLFGKWMQDLPYEHTAILTEEEKAFVLKYCFNDLAATELLFLALQEAIELREAISGQLGVDVRSKSDSQMGMAIIKKRIEQITGRRVVKSESNTHMAFRYTAPSYIRFDRSDLNELLDHIQAHQFVTNSDGKVDLPKWLSDTKIKIGPSTFQMGIGGLHSTESNRSVVADADNAIISVDVQSYYPALILTLGLAPKATGEAFLTAYGGIRDDRVRAKKAGDKVIDKSLKIALNGGGFGLLGNRYSISYAPDLLIAVTLTGQLALLMLIERAFGAGIPTISANTDGIEMFCPRALYDGFVRRDDGKLTDRLRPSTVQAVVEQWEADTGFILEGVEYTGLYNQSVNSYIALKAGGGHKRKGPMANPWNPHPADFDPRGQLMKNPAATICSDAVLNFIKDGTPIEKTIRECQDVRAFVTVVNATGGATWRDGYLGKVVRFYWSTDGDPIYKVKAHATTGNRPKVPKTDGCRPIMTLPDDFAVPADVDYGRYIAEAREMLKTLGVEQRETMFELFMRTIWPKRIPGYEATRLAKSTKC